MNHPLSNGCCHGGLDCLQSDQEAEDRLVDWSEGVPVDDKKTGRMMDIYRNKQIATHPWNSFGAKIDAHKRFHGSNVVFSGHRRLPFKVEASVPRSRQPGML